MSGDKRGLWYNFETGESGNLLSLIQKETGLPFKESLKYVADICGEGLYVNSFKQFENNIQLRAKYNKNQSNYVRFLTARKIIERFLNCDRIVSKEIRYRRYTVNELAEKLSISEAELEMLIKASSSIFCQRIIGRIILPLIKLYCNTKWVDSK